MQGTVPPFVTREMFLEGLGCTGQGARLGLVLKEPANGGAGRPEAVRVTQGERAS